LKKDNKNAEFEREDELKDLQLKKESQTPEIRSYNLIQEAKTNISGKYYEEIKTVF